MNEILGTFVKVLVEISLRLTVGTVRRLVASLIVRADISQETVLHCALGRVRVGAGRTSGNVRHVGVSRVKSIGGLAYCVFPCVTLRGGATLLDCTS